jgi:EmrB/QacA subfamily drug resistance transporter
MLSIFLAAMEGTVVGTAMPTAVASLGGIEIYSWVFSAYLLTSTVSMPLWGRLSDLFGHQRIALVGLAIFLSGSALSGLAQSMAQLVIFRVLQGIGAGSLITIGYTIVGALYSLEQRAKIQGVISGVWGIAAILGPLIGGTIVDHLSWRWVFYINLPFGALAALAIGVGLDEPRSARRAASIDYRGALLFTGMVTALLLGLVEGGREASWGTPKVLGLLILSGALLVAVLAVERRVREPLIPLELFRNRVVRAAAVTGFLAGMAMFGGISYVPLYVQAVIGTSATEAGAVLVAFSLGWFVLSVVGVRLVLRIGYRVVVVAGMVSLTLSFLLLAALDQSSTALAVARDLVFGGLGMGMVMPPMLVAVQTAVQKRDLGAATSFTQFFRSIGGAVGVSVMGAVMAHRLQTELGPVQRLLGDDAARRLLQELIRPGGSASALQGLVLSSVRQLLAHALHGVFLVGLAVCLLALLSAFLVPPGRAQELAAPRREAAT